VYSYAVTKLHCDEGCVGVGITFTLGDGNDLVCRAIELLAGEFHGQEIGEVMGQFGARLHRLKNHPRLRWLGPDKGLMHLALASIVNACFDLWAKAQRKPLWSLLVDLAPEQIVALLDFTGVEDVLSRDEALELIGQQNRGRSERCGVLRSGYPAYDTSVGWINYGDQEIVRNSLKAVGAGFGAVKLKVGSSDPARDIRRLYLLRDALGDGVKIMLDANQQWEYRQARYIGNEIRGMNPYWIEEPLHPDDVVGHSRLQGELAPIHIAAGEHIPNAVMFKNFLEMKALSVCQVDCTRVAGVSEFILVSLLARKFAVKVIPHVGDMGQIHQHLVLFNHIVLGLDLAFLEYIPHMQRYFKHPAVVRHGVYGIPQEAGASCDFVGRA
jgi:L-fuconate dehydratase